MCKKRYFLFIIFFFISIVHHGQTILPPYQEVKEKFVSNYQYEPESPELLLRFAKKKQGWHVTIIDFYKNDRVLHEYLFWDMKDKKYRSLSNFFRNPADDESIERTRRVINYGYIDYYGYERCRYYGYNEWAWDMINDFRGQKNLSDTMMEGLARAYSFYASGFLYYQYGGGHSDNNPLRRELGRLERPGKERIAVAQKYYDSSTAVFKQLAINYPSYQTIVGNSAMKYFNELMNGYMQMRLCRDKIAAKKFLDIIEPDTTIKAISINYLGACEPNAILFTYGDNDTYPLWYMQDKYNYRKDVTVVNTSLLGLSPWVNYLKEENIISFTSTPKVYGNRNLDYIILETEKEKRLIEPQTLSDFLKYIQSKAAAPVIDKTNQTIRYHANEIVIPVDIKKFNSYDGYALAPAIRFEIGDYLLLNNIIKLDIINSNISKRPIYFTIRDEQFRTSLMEEGFIYKLLPLPLSPGDYRNNPHSIEKIETFLTRTLVPVLSGQPLEKISVTEDFDYEIMNLYDLVSKDYYDSEKSEKARYWALKAYSIFKNAELPAHTSTLDLARILILTNEKEKGIEMLERSAKRVYTIYKHPTALKKDFDKEFISYYLELIKEILTDNDLESKIFDEIEDKFNKEK